MTVSDDLATLRLIPRLENAEKYDAALARVEAEIARLDELVESYGPSTDMRPVDFLHGLIEGLLTERDEERAKVARLREAAAIADKLELGWHKPYTDEMERRQDAEAEVARLQDGLRRISGFGHEPGLTSYQNIERVRASARALLADDGAAQPKVYPANDWEKITADCVACPGCGFTFDAFHVTQATGQYDCPVCHAQSQDGAA